MGIGHRIRTIQNPDMRVKLIKEYALEHFPRTPVLDFALEVEKVTTQKKSTLRSRASFLHAWISRQMLDVHL
jgi:ATP citrate (pro-S)-lyase